MSNSQKSISCDDTQKNVKTKVEKTLTDQEIEKSPESKMRKLHKSYIKGWSEDIAKNGVARCLMESCNFISSDLLCMQYHHKTCSVSAEFDNLVSKRGDSLHFRVIKRMKNSKSSEDHIIQPMPDFPKGQYRRRRPYSVQHKKSWALSLEKYKYVKCIYQNCYFIAMSLEDMISHFGYCNGDGSFANFVCPYCKGRVTSEDILLKHIERSHHSENKEIKIEPLTDNREILFTNMESPNIEESCLQSSENQNEVTKIRQSACWKVWKSEIDQYGHAFCRKSLCNFMAPNIPALEIHLRTCDGTPDFEFLNCPKCRYRLPTKEDLTRHLQICKDERVNRFPAYEGMNPVQDTEPVFCQNQTGCLKSYSRNRKENSNPTPKPSEGENNVNTTEETNKTQESITEEVTTTRKRGRPKSGTKKVEEVSQNNQDVKCGKCSNFQGTKKGFDEHNLKTHIGLGWIEGQTPVDMNDEKLLIRLVKDAFKVIKKASCEKCDDVKRSVMGFVSHIQNCGKSEEERDALKVPCPHCGGKYLKYSLGTHIKFCNANPNVAEEITENPEVASEPCGKRRSAIKAVSKFQEVLNENEEPESSREHNYFIFEKGIERLPKLNNKLTNLWYKLKRENKKIPCRHRNCTNLSRDVKEAKSHHFTCPLLPEKVFMCEGCDFYSVDEPTVQTHVTTHRKYLKQRKINGDDEDVKLEDESNENDDEDYEDKDELEDEDEEEEGTRSSDDDLDSFSDGFKSKKRRKKDPNVVSKKQKMSAVKLDPDVENRLKQNFCKREKIDNVRGIQFYSNGLNMTLEVELSKPETTESWPELHTSLQDWFPVKSHDYFPELLRSVSVRFDNEKWRRFERFESDIIEGVPVMFTGGSIRSMSWCKVSVKRMLKKIQKQFLAVSTARNADCTKDIHERSSLNRSTLIQIWDCGALENSPARIPPKFCLGIVHESGEVWDLAWFPEDTSAEGTEDRLRRLGLLATASEDGFVRVWSICDPEGLNNSVGLPVYKTEPVVMLEAHENEICLQLDVGPNGILAGGFSSGAVAFWNLRNIRTPFCKKSEKCKILRAYLVIQAHKTAITALTFCPLDSRYICTAGLDRFVKVWDTDFPSFPVEQYTKEYSLDNIWTMNWPSLIFNFDDVVLNFNKGAVKFVKDILTERHQSTFAMEDTCLSLSFSNWLNALCGGSITGEVKLRLLKNLIHDQKRSQSTISTIRLERLNGSEKQESKNVSDGTMPKTYGEIYSGWGLVFKDYLGMDKGKPRKPESHPEEFLIRAVNKIACNPNFLSFTHIALGYNCGFIRIQPLKELQTAKSLKFFLEKLQKKNL